MKEKKRRRAERKSVATAGGGLMFCSANTVKTEIGHHSNPLIRLSINSLIYLFDGYFTR